MREPPPHSRAPGPPPLIALLSAALTLTLACEAPTPVEVPETSGAEATDEIKPPPSIAPILAAAAARRPWMDLRETAHRAHLWRSGPVFDPGGPGWDPVAALGPRTAWLPVRTAGERTVAYPDGIGASLRFPITAGDQPIDRLSLWMKPLGTGQRVSVFLDEEPLGTLELSSKARRYTLPLPDGALTPGEHHVRFYFRFTRYLGKARTPAAVDQVRLLGPGEPAPLPETWIAPLSAGGVEGDALLAGPPSRWTWYLHPPPGARLTVKPAVASGAPVEFAVRVRQDGAEPTTPWSAKVSPGASVEAAIDLAPWADQPIALELSTTTEADEPGPLIRAGWIDPIIGMPESPAFDLPEVDNVIIWVVDGLRADRVALGRSGERASTPNLDLLAAEGGAAVDVWTGGILPDDGHRGLIQPGGEGAPMLAEALATTERQTAYMGTSRGAPEELLTSFGGRFDLRGEGENAETRLVLRELDAWLETRRKGRFVLYVTSDDPRAPYTPAPGYVRLYREARAAARLAREDKVAAEALADRIAYDAQATAADYWVGQMVALLAARKLQASTAIVVVGAVGQGMRGAETEADGYALKPELLQVPLVVWHPGLRADGATRALVHGGQMKDVAALIMRLVGGEPPAAWGARAFDGPLFDGHPLPDQLAEARVGPLSAARIGRWFLKGSGPHGLNLWRLDRDPELAQDLAPDHPIALRFMRDGLLRPPPAPDAP